MAESFAAQESGTQPTATTLTHFENIWDITSSHHVHTSLSPVTSCNFTLPSLKFRRGVLPPDNRAVLIVLSSRALNSGVRNKNGKVKDARALRVFIVLSVFSPREAKLNFAAFFPPSFLMYVHIP